MRVLFSRPDDDRIAWLRFILIGAVPIAIGVFVAQTSCRAPLEQKKGYVGDFCNGGDDECQEGLVCKDGICTSLNDSPKVCNAVCARFQQCGATPSNCQSSCLKTLKEWTRRMTRLYGKCYQQTSCEEFRDSDRPWNYCYRQLPPASEKRLEVCDRLEKQSNRCLESQDIDPKGRVKNMKRACKTEARTVSNELWKKNALCAKQRDDDGNLRCGKLFKCANQQFEISGANKLPTSPPG